MKKHCSLLLLMLCIFSMDSIAQKEKPKKKKKGDSSSYSVPVPQMEEKVVESIEVREYSGTKGVGDTYDIVEAPRMVEEAPAPYSSNYYGNRTSRKIDTSKAVLDIAGKYFLVNIGNNSTYYNQFGVEDANGKTVLPTVYSSIIKCDDGYIVKLGSVSSLLDTAFKIIFPMEYENIEPINDKGIYLLRKKSSGTQIVNKSGVLQVQVPLRYATPLGYRYSATNKNSDFLQLENFEGKKAIYDLGKKKLVIGFVAKNITAYETGIIVTEDTCTRILNGKDLSPLIAETFTTVMFPRNGTSAFIVSKKGKMGLVSPAGKYVLPCDQNSIVQIDNNALPALYIASKNGKYTCVDYLGKNILNESFDFIRTFYGNSNGLLFVKSGNKHGVRDYLNHTIMPIEFDTIYYANYGNSFTGRKANKTITYTTQGTIVNEFEFDKIEPAGSGMFIYQKNNKVGIAGGNFELMTEPLFDKLELFNAYGYSGYSYGETLFKATKSGKIGLINKRGEVMLPFIYDAIEQLDESAILLKQNGKYGLVKASGYKAIAPCEYDAIGNAVRNENDRYNSIKKYIGIKNGEAIVLY